MTGVPLVLALARGRLDALRVFCMFGGAFAWPRPGRSSSASAGRRAAAGDSGRQRSVPPQRARHHAQRRPPL